MHHVKACDLHLHVGEDFTTIGWLVPGKTVQTKDGDPMKFVSFEDTTLMVHWIDFMDRNSQQLGSLRSISGPRIKGCPDLSTDPGHPGFSSY